MPTPPARDVTRLLLDWRQGEPAALERLLPLVYAELRKIAHARMRAEPPGGQTLQTTALVNEAYVRLVDGARVDWQNRAHFYAVCARLMRRILVDRARARRADKRGGEAHASRSATGLAPCRRKTRSCSPSTRRSSACPPVMPGRARSWSCGTRRTDRRGDRGGARDVAGDGDAGLEGGQAVAGAGAQGGGSGVGAAFDGQGAAGQGVIWPVRPASPTSCGWSRGPGARACGTRGLPRRRLRRRRGAAARGRGAARGATSGSGLLDTGLDAGRPPLAAGTRLGPYRSRR